MFRRSTRNGGQRGAWAGLITLPPASTWPGHFLTKRTRLHLQREQSTNQSYHPPQCRTSLRDGTDITPVHTYDEPMCAFDLLLTSRIRHVMMACLMSTIQAARFHSPSKSSRLAFILLRLGRLNWLEAEVVTTGSTPRFEKNLLEILQLTLKVPTVISTCERLRDGSVNVVENVFCVCSDVLAECLVQEFDFKCGLPVGIALA